VRSRSAERAGEWRHAGGQQAIAALLLAERALCKDVLRKQRRCARNICFGVLRRGAVHAAYARYARRASVAREFASARAAYAPAVCAEMARAAASEVGRGGCASANGSAYVRGGVRAAAVLHVLFRRRRTTPTISRHGAHASPRAIPNGDSIGIYDSERQARRIIHQPAVRKRPRHIFGRTRAGRCYALMVRRLSVHAVPAVWLNRRSARSA